MQYEQGAVDNWFQRRFGPGAWQGLAPARRLAWCLGGAAGALMLLAAFYGVLHQSLARADQHWARAPGAGAQACGSARGLTAADGCTGLTRDTAGLGPATPGVRLVASPR